LLKNWVATNSQIFPDLSGKEKWKKFSIVNQWLTVKKS
jgi:hypothetical protein